MTRILLYIIFVMLITLQPLSKATAGVAERNNFLTQVLSLSEKPKAYFIIDLGGNKITLMARSVAIREWSIDGLQFSGDPIPENTYVMEKKSIQLDDLREKNYINPDGTMVKSNVGTTNDVDTKKGDNKKDDDKKDKKLPGIGMEITDMPTDYSLFINGEITIHVSSKAEGSGSFLKNTFNAFKSYAYYPISKIFNSHHKNAHSEIAISFKDKTEVQALFWAFRDGMECIILPPGLENREDYQL
jgi:hypothetical protein